MNMEFILTEVLRFRILVGVLILLSIFLLVSRIGRQPPSKLRLFLLQAGIVSAIVALIALVFSGYLHWIFAVAGGLLPIVVRLLPLLWRAPAAKPEAPRPLNGRSSRSSSRRSSRSRSSSAESSGENGRTKVETRYLRMSLSQQSGEMRGKILKGTHAGAHLSELTLKKLQALHAEYIRRDAESAALLAAYMEQVHGVRQESGETQSEQADDRQQSERRKTNGKGMSREEAYEILGLKAGADSKAVTEAHRRLMQKIHPDRGGTNYLAAKINQAKDLLAG
jgi:hypothetical protein